MILLGKTFDELMEASLSKLVSSGIITNLSRGGIARSLTETINQNVSDFYVALDLNMSMAFLSTATGSYVDLIGYLLDCERLTDEDDDDYKYRITQQVYTAASANQTAVTLKCLAVEGVRDVVIHEFTQGTGSFSVCVIPEDSTQINTVVQLVQEAIDDVKGLGIKGVASSPKMIPLRLSVQLIFQNGVFSQETADNVKREIINYIEYMSIGDELIVTELVQRIMNVSEEIKDIEFTSFYVNNKPALLVNQTIYWDEKFYPDVITVS